MYLHNDKNLFSDILSETSRKYNLPVEIIEKDYFVTVFLKQIVKVQPDIIFKGGTSLSKCFKLIERFSEDIDLNLECEQKPTEGQQRKLKAAILGVTDELGLTLTNPDNIRSRRDFNRYIIDYDSAFDNSFLKQHLIVEIAVFLRSYPSVKMKASCFISDYLNEINRDDIIAEYGLYPFELNVQSAERTMIDKLFALCDYYLSDTAAGYSRHIYDIYKLLGVVEINDELRELAATVREERKGHTTCLSAADDVDMNALLREIADKEIYRKDYENTTQSLLFEKVTYPEAAKALDTIIESKIF